MMSCNVYLVSLCHNSEVTQYAVNMLFKGHKDKGTIYLVLQIVQQLQDKSEDENCPLLNVDWIL